MPPPSPPSSSEVGPNSSGAQLRQAASDGGFTGPTTGLATGYVHTNLVILPQRVAADFAGFVADNRRLRAMPCLEMQQPGDPCSELLAPGADVRHCLPGYLVWHGSGDSSPSARTETRAQVQAQVQVQVQAHNDVTATWEIKADHVPTVFHFGCSFTFEAALSEAGLPPKHIALGSNVAMFNTNIATRPFGPFGGPSAPLVVSMRPYPLAALERIRAVCAPYGRAHGAPLTCNPAVLGIADLDHPDYGDPVPLADDEVPVFWACGVTTQVAIQDALERGTLDWAITHQPGRMFVADLGATELTSTAAEDLALAQESIETLLKEGYCQRAEP